MSSHPNPYEHLTSRQTGWSFLFEEQAAATGADLKDLLDASDLPNSDKAALAQAWGGPEAAAEYRTDDTDRVARTPQPAATARVGDTVFVGGLPYEVTEIRDHAPGQHADSPIKDQCYAREVVTEAGSRWFGHTPGDAYRGAEILDQRPDGIRIDFAPAATAVEPRNTPTDQDHDEY